MSDYTKGPWTHMSSFEIYAFHDETGIDSPEHSTPIAQVEFEKAKSDVEAKANGDLIAAAPEMLEALQLAFKVIEGAQGPNSCNGEIVMWQDIAASISSAIDKATGKESE